MNIQLHRLNIHYLWIAMLGLLLLALPFAGIAQETSGGITGKITDEKGSPLAAADVIIVHLPSGTTYPVSTEKDGRYRVLGLHPGGPYVVTASTPGLASIQFDNLFVKLGEPLQLNIVLRKGNEQLKEIEIKTSRQRTTANTYGAGEYISKDRIKNMPAINRSLQDMTRLVPQGSKDNSFGGTNFRYNNVTIDGAINNDAIGFSPSMGGQNGTSGQPGSSTRTNPVSLDAIEDIQVYLAPFDVKIGNFTGGSVNAVTRKGTNKWSGSIYGFGRNATLVGKDRKGNSGSMPADFQDYQAGFRLGFPIVRNKLFFFTNMELTRRTDPLLLRVGIPETSGILSVKDAADIISTTRQRYDAFDPSTGGNYNTSSRSNKFFGRIDWNINSKHQLSLRNNTIFSNAMHMDRDQQDFRFSSMAFEQTNNQTGTVAELKSRFTNTLSNSLVVGYSSVNDYRTPQSNPNLPQIQIAGRSPGTTIYIGTDREASIFNMKQRVLEITDNITWTKGKHTFLFGTHNELYNINYGFVNSWNGRVDYLSIEDYIANNPYRVRGSYNYINNSRDYILNHPAAVFRVNMYSAYVQDEIQLNDRLKITPGLRIDYTHLPDKPSLTDRVQDSPADPFYGNTYYYTPLQRLSGNYLNRVQLSPRIGIRYDVLGDQRLIIRGGAGIFTGRIPFAWLAYAYYNNGLSYGSFDQRADQQPFAPGSDANRPGNNGIADFISQNGVLINNPRTGKTQVDLVDNNFTMPKVLRASAAVAYTTDSRWKLGIEGIITKTLKDVFFQQVNITDNPVYYYYDKQRQQPIYTGTINPGFSNAYLLSNTNKGFRYSITGTISKDFAKGLSLSGAYTYGKSKDVFNGVRNSMESNWQLNQALNPNNAGLSYSNFDIRHRIIFNADYRKPWNDKWISSLHLFVSAQSGSPFTYGILNNSIQGLPQQVNLAYIPSSTEAVEFFNTYQAANGAIITAAEQAAAFNTFIDGDKYLSSRRGQFTERNSGRTPWNVQADLHFTQEYHFRGSKDKFLSFTIDVINLTNLLYKEWGIQYFSPNTFNATASIGLTPTLFPPQQNPKQGPVYRFNHPGKPYAIDYFGSRSQVQLGVRYTF
ncbi:MULTISPECIES: TonB-dependent receptor [Chitinophaga]|uniref:TonB-dependent receptor n=1 Tax=Chitinophaga TaxID=79328 RepID=UPI001CEC6702|nr:MULTISPECIES: TonB-dependent receptor [Chitinophaga]